MDRKLLDILACPDCKGPLKYDRKAEQLLCRRCRLIYPINDKGVPIMIIDEAKPMAPDDEG